MIAKCLALCWMEKMHASQIFPSGKRRIWLVEQDIKYKKFLDNVKEPTFKDEIVG